MPVQFLAIKLVAEQEAAMRAGDRFRLGVIRMLRSEMHNAKIAKKTALEPDEELTIVSREVKRRQEALIDFRKADRPELVESLEREIDILKAYLPEQLTETELAAQIDQAIAESGAVSMKEMGKVMGLLMPRVKGKVDGALVRRVVEERLR